jgi:glycosyltransferase involved in cell wall biosynthesis
MRIAILTSGILPVPAVRGGAVENLIDFYLAILDLYEHPEKRRAMSEAALKRSKLFSKERYAREFFEALEITT